MPAIQVQHLSKKYQIYAQPGDKLREVLRLSRKALHREFWALENVTFEANQGETLGIIGQNGSGKSTLLQILAGIMRQTRGDCYVHGKVAALLELGSGFNPEFTGRENVFMNGAILGLDTRQMEERFDAITDFAEIGSFIEQPVKTYSSGMFMRLAFAVAVNVDPDILLALLLDAGHLIEDGKPDLVVQKYRALIFERERRYGGFESAAAERGDTETRTDNGQVPRADTIPNVDHRFGSGDATILGVELLGSEGKVTREVFGGERVIVRVSVRFNQDIQNPIIGYTMRDRLGVELTACNTSYAGKFLPPVRKDQVVTSDFHIALPYLASGSYSISPAVAKGEILKHDMCDWIDNALVFSLQSDRLVYGQLRMDVDVKNYLSP
jgi:lipopolysaccharide transport system ATP-binding protein